MQRKEKDSDIVLAGGLDYILLYSSNLQTHILVRQEDPSLKVQEIKAYLQNLSSDSSLLAMRKFLGKINLIKTRHT